MKTYLFRISTKRANAWSNKKSKPIYFVCSTKDEAISFVESRLVDGLSVSKVTRLAEQVAGSIFYGL